jgi:hypothetical protein
VFSGEPSLVVCVSVVPWVTAGVTANVVVEF